eukprot:4786585-Pleurochrysis_carterae.AAC.1
MDLKGWGKVGALSAFKMKDTGQVMFTAGRDFVRPGVGADEGRIFVQLLDAGSADALPLSVEQL